MTLRELLQHRLAGRKPDFPLFLTLAPEVHQYIPGQTVSIGPNDDLDVFTGLLVFVCCHSTQGDAALEIIERLFDVEPFTLIFWVIDQGVMQNVIECDARTNTRAVPNDELRITVEALKCSS